MSKSRASLKRVLARVPDFSRTTGLTLLTYHRICGKGRDELDVSVSDFEAQLDILSSRRVASIGAAVAALERGQTDESIVLTFDDGFGDVYSNAWPRLRERGIPFTVYVSSKYVGGVMDWPGSTAKESGAAALNWAQLEEMMASGLCTIGNHTHSHARPEELSESELDRCTHLLRTRLSVRPEHFAYTWGRPVASMEGALRQRFRSAATGSVGRNYPGTDLMRLRRVPVRGSDPISFFQAKLTGGLVAERMYGATVSTAKRVGIRA